MQITQIKSIIQKELISQFYEILFLGAPSGKAER